MDALFPESHGLLVSLLIFVLFFIAKEDFQQRSIHIGWLGALGILGIVYGWVYQQPAMNLMTIGINIGFIGLQLLLISLYFSIKAKRWVNIADSLLGWGDIVFFFLLCLLLPTLHLIWFYTLSLVMVLLFFLIIKKIYLPELVTIPLAGGMSICLMVYLIGMFFAKAKFDFC